MKVAWQPAEDRNQLPTQEFCITREGQRNITGAVWLPPQTDDDIADTLMCFGHGASGDRYQAPICYMAERFSREAQIPVLSLDGPVHGLRQVGEGGRKAFGPEYIRQGALDDMTMDWHLAIEATQNLLNMGKSKLAYFGLSMGSIFGIPLVASRDDCKVATLGLFGIQERTPHREQFLAACADITCPVLYLMQLEDELFSREGCLLAFDALSSADKSLHANPGLHPAVPVSEVDHAYAFLLSHIRGEADDRVINIIAD